MDQTKQLFKIYKFIHSLIVPIAFCPKIHSLHIYCRQTVAYRRSHQNTTEAALALQARAASVKRL